MRVSARPPRRVRGGRRFAAVLAVVAASVPAWTAAGGPDTTKGDRAVGAHDHDSHAHSHTDAGHEQSEGFTLAAQTGTTPAGSACKPSMPRREIALSAIAVDVTLNRFGDHDPRGRMFAFTDLTDEIRAEEKRNADARTGRGDYAVTPGLQGDAIQPPVVRARPGECLRLTVRNDLDEPASLHVHGGALMVGAAPAVATNPTATAAPGATVTYTWAIPAGEREGTHYFHSHGDERAQTSHGMFGAIVIEPSGSRWTDPRTGEDARGWDAVITPPDGRAFREFALFYHEVGDEQYQLRAADDSLVPLVDPLLSAYRPGSRAINFRSEPFMNRMRLQQRLTGRFDESLAYSSYAFGDPATPILRAYLGEPVKQRLVHGGSEVFHVHHVHGGSIRWRRQPDADSSPVNAGLDKRPPLTPVASERTDSQSIGPSETFDIAGDCGAGGCQQSAGDFLVHCHVAHHYFAGMWGIWRVYNTLQDGSASTDALPPLPPLRAGTVVAAVTSSALAGRSVTFAGRARTVADASEWAAMQLPPAGPPGEYDASVWDWRVEGGIVVGEPEDARRWPGHAPAAPGRRPPILFDPQTGLLAYPFLRPQLGRRPPFAPGHAPSPFLDPGLGPDPPAPGASGPASLCPAGTTIRTFFVNAVSLAVPLNRRAGLTDPGGQLYVLAEDEAAARADPALRGPLAIRANASEDCVDVVLASSIPDGPINHGFSKVNLHIHFVQFDVQASDGVVNGFNYEQSVRPYTADPVTARAAAAGAPGVTVSAAGRFRPGIVVGIGLGTDRFEARRISRIEGTRLILDAPLARSHPDGEIVSTEFVRYRWYPDVQSGTAYFHDHVNAIASWRHGLFGALVVEPPGSTYHDPASGTQIRSGAIADIVTNARVSADVTGSFREAVLFLQDDQPIGHEGRSSGSAINQRIEPLRGRDPPPRAFASTRGDPETPLIRAHLGDPVVVRTLVAGTNDIHTIHVDGHWFRLEPWSRSSRPVSTARIGISERMDLVLPAAGGPQRMPGDYLYTNGRAFKIREGSWGLLRVLDPSDESIRALPGREPATPATSVCPPGAPTRRFRAAAVPATIPSLGGEAAAFVAESARSAVEAGGLPEPFVLRASVGDCIEVSLANATGAPVSLHADLLAYDPSSSAGVAAGSEPVQAAAPGTSRTYTFFASPEIGETVAMLRDGADLAGGSRRGLHGAVVVGPPGTVYRDPRTGAETSSGWLTDAVVPGRTAWRDAVLLWIDDDAGLGTHRMPYSTAVGGAVAVNGRTEPLRERRATDSKTARAYDPATHGDPATPLIRAEAGDAIRIAVLVPSGEQVQVFSVEGHRWPIEPGMRGSALVSSAAVGGLDAMVARFRAGAPADYLWVNHRIPYLEAGMWGLLRVRDCGAAGIDHLPGSPCDGIGIGVAGIAAAALAAGLGAYAVHRRRRGRRATA